MTAPRKPSEILEAAGDLLAKPGAWTQGASATNEDGDDVGIFSPEAVCFCSYGAVQRTGWNVVAWEYLKAQTGQAPVSFNDTTGRTQTEVVAAFRKAAKLAREAGE